MFKGPLAPSGKIRWMCRAARSEGRRYCYSTTSPASPARKQSGKVAGTSTSKKDTVYKRKLSDSKVYVITAAQNGTPIHEVFWGCLKTAAKHRGAELLVIPIRYKNPTSEWTESQANEEQWATEVVPYLWNVRKALNENLVVMGDIKTQPTASDPLSRCDPMTGGASGIIGHVKVALRSIPAPANKMPKIMATTGACTVANYTDSKAGKLGEFHHTLAALIVEVKGKKFHLRQLYYDGKTQSFTDLDTRYYEDRVAKAPRPLALVMGDTHVDFIDPAVEQATFGKGGMTETLKPRHLVFHDLLDGYSVNPHHNGNPFNAIAKMMSGKDDVAAEVKRACHFVKDRTPEDCLSLIVPSNHDDFLRRWIVSHDWKSDPKNAEFYLATALEMVRGTKMGKGGTVYPSPFPMIFPQVVDTSNIRLLKGESFTLGGIALEMHGDRGANGARGSIKGFKRIGVRTIIGHSHSPGIEDGCVQIGTSTYLSLEYTGGPSSWLNAHCLVHEDGKRQLIIIVDGSWRLGKAS